MSETRKYFEHITGKSERVLPTEPGWWWYRPHPSHNRPDTFVLVRKATRSGRLIFKSSFTGEVLAVEDVNGEWLEPVAPLGTAARLAVADADRQRILWVRDTLKLAINSTETQAEMLIDEVIARLADAEADVSHARHVIHGTGQLGASLREEAELVAAALTQTRKMLSAAEAELAELKQRIASAPVAWVQFGNHNNPCEISEDRETFWDGEHPPGTLRQCRLLEVRDEE